MINEITSSPLFGIVLCICAFLLGTLISKKTRLAIANPLVLAVIFVITALAVFNIPIENFKKGGDIINMFLIPATTVLAVSIYSRFDTLKKNLLPIIAGIVAGTAASITSVYIMCKLFKLDEIVTISLLPKSVTTPIAIALSGEAGGLPPVTVAAVLITGIFGVMAAPLMIKLFRFTDPVSIGVAMGTSSHAIGTSKALEMGETEGAVSGTAIGLAGLATVIVFSFII